MLEPIRTLEFVLPRAWFGSDRNGGDCSAGRPSISRLAYEKNWSHQPAFNYSAWHVGVAMKLGWRF